MSHRLQNIIAESSITLPAAAIIATVLWWLPIERYSVALLLGWITTVLTTYVIMETATQNSLLRLRSRMDAALFLLIMAACSNLHALTSATATMPLLAGSFFCLLRTYEKPRPQLDTFHAYLLLSLASLAQPPLLLLTPVFLIVQIIHLRTLTLEASGAVVCALVLPYLFWAPAALTLGNPQPFMDHAAAILAPFTEPSYWLWAVAPLQSGNWETISNAITSHIRQQALTHLQLTATLVFMTLLAFTGVVHYLRHSFDDKIRVRMCHYTFIEVLVVAFIWLILQPQQVHMLLPIIIIAAVPSAAHFIALTHSRLSNFWVVTLALLLATIPLVTTFATYFWD